MPPPVGGSIGGGKITVNIKRLDLRSGDGSGGGEKDKEEGRVGVRAISKRGAGGGGDLNITVRGMDLIRGRGLVQGSQDKPGVASPSPSRTQVACLNQIDAGPRTNFTTARVQRTLCFDETEEAMFLTNHQLFLCRADASLCTTLTVYVQAMIQTLVRRIQTPGSLPKHTSSTTNPEIKAAIKEVYVLIKCLNKAGYSLCGEFTTENFVTDKVKGQINIRFSGLQAEAFKKSNPDNDNLDILGFKKMVRRQIFKNMIVPHDLNLWLSLIGKEELQHLMPHHIYLLDYKDWTDPFLKWYDIWQNLKDVDSEKFSKILDGLEDYKGWKAVLKGQERNNLLLDTLTYVDPRKQKEVDYRDDAYGLIHLLRNCRHHPALKYLEFFSLIASQFFPNLISDFQLAMVKAGCIKLPTG